MQSYKAQLHSPARKRDSTRRSDYARDRRRRYCASSSIQPTLHCAWGQLSDFFPSRRVVSGSGSKPPATSWESVPLVLRLTRSVTEAPQRISSVVDLAVADIQFRGRWKCFESLCRYLQQAAGIAVDPATTACRRPSQTLPRSWASVWGRKPCPLRPAFAALLLEACPGHGHCTPDTGTPVRSIGLRVCLLWPLASSRARDRSARAGPRVSRSREALR
jgi:hypothetical protein